MKDDYLTDAILVEQVQNGNSQAMDTLVFRHKATAYQFAHRLTHDRDLAADVVAEAFVRMYRSSHSFRGQSSLTTWLYRIVTNCFLDMRKKASRRQTLSLAWMLDRNEGGPETMASARSRDPYSLLIAGEQNRSIAEKTAHLPDFQRIIIQLYHVEMRSYEEIAEILDLPLGTVKSRLNRARLSLRQSLKSDRSLFVDELSESSKPRPNRRAYLS